jgi:hypothetical protein
VVLLGEGVEFVSVELLVVERLASLGLVLIPAGATGEVHQIQENPASNTPSNNALFTKYINRIHLQWSNNKNPEVMGSRVLSDHKLVKRQILPSVGIGHIWDLGSTGAGIYVCIKIF